MTNHMNDHPHEWPTAWMTIHMNDQPHEWPSTWMTIHMNDHPHEWWSTGMTIHMNDHPHEWPSDYWTDNQLVTRLTNLYAPLPTDYFALFIPGHHRKYKISLFQCWCWKVDLRFDGYYLTIFSNRNSTVKNECYVLYRVDFVKYPGLAKVEYHYVEMQPGDCLYIPYRW